MTKEFFQRNRQSFLNFLEDEAVAVLHSGYSAFKTADQTHPYLVNRNFYYLTGINQENVILLIGKNIEMLFIAPIDEVMSKWVGRTLTKEEASELSGISVDKIKYLNTFENTLFMMFQNTRHNTLVANQLYLDLERRNLPLYTSYAYRLCNKVKTEFPAITIKNCYPLIIKLRTQKQPEEIELMKESINTTNRAILNVMKHHNELVNESFGEAYHDFILITESKQKSFNNIIAAGHNGTILHYEENNQDIKENSLLLMDVGCFTNQYSSDISRTFPVSGKFTERQKEVYEVVLNCNKKCIEFLKPGITFKEYNDYAKKLLFEGCKKLGLLETEAELSKYYYHSIGHSLGLDVHDPAIEKDGILEGMVLTVEPGLYIEEESIGIRIEDDVLITKDGAVNLSSNIIKEVKDIEEFMK